MLSRLLFLLRDRALSLLRELIDIILKLGREIFNVCELLLHDPLELLLDLCGLRLQLLDFTPLCVFDLLLSGLRFKRRSCKSRVRSLWRSHPQNISTGFKSGLLAGTPHNTIFFER